MPCCCASNVKAAYVIGIILAVLYALGIIFSFKKLNNGITFESTFDIIIGFLGLVSASILAYGAHTRNSKAMIIYMVSAVLIIILFIFVTVHAMVNTFIGDDNLSKIVEEACKGQENYLRIYGPSLKNKSIKKSNGNFTYYIR